VNRQLPKILSSTWILVFFLFSIAVSGVILFSSLTNIAYAQLSGCAQIDIGNPPANFKPPAQCATGDGSVVWPFPVKSPSQFNRVDQGWDLEYKSMGNNVRAVVSGTVNINHGANACNFGGGFGDTYPIEVLDKPITVNGRTYKEIYYGHTADVKLGKVQAGDVIAKTWDCVSFDSGATYVPWLEIGFYGPGGPVGHGAFPTQPGSDMKQWLNANTK
jgi:hypothetical protein